MRKTNELKISKGFQELDSEELTKVDGGGLLFYKKIYLYFHGLCFNRSYVHCGSNKNNNKNHDCDSSNSNSSGSQCTCDPCLPR